MSAALDHLEAELDWLRTLLLRLVQDTPATPEVPPSPSYLRREDVEPLVAGPSDLGAARARADALATADLPLVRIQERFRPGVVQRLALLLALSDAVSARWRPVIAYLQDDLAARAPRVSLLLQVAPADQVWRAFEPGTAWSRLPGLSLTAADRFDLREIRADETLVRFVRGQTVFPASFSAWLTPGIQRPSDAARAEASRWLEHAPDRVARFITTDAVDVQSAVGERVGVIAFDPSAAVYRGKAAEALTAAAEHARLTGQALVVASGLAEPELRAAFITAARDPLVCAAVATPEEVDLRPLLHHRLVFEASVPVMPEAERRRHWARVAPGTSQAERGILASTFVLGATRIERAAAMAADQRLASLEAACRAVTRVPTRGLASSISREASWEDLVAPIQTRLRLQEIIEAVRYREQVFDDWGVKSRIAGQPGTVALFHGPPGTGKTLAASVIANALGLPLLRVDLAGLVSKYIGETEKNLREVFRTARSTRAVLFFDEADAVLGKRTAVNDAHDRYANVQTSYLLQELERYDGIAILATNFKVNIDTAFLRRIDTIVEFAAPDRAARRQLWELLAVPVVGELDEDVLERLVELKLSGGHVRNIVQQAAILAAPDGVRPGPAHLLLAALHELGKAGRPQSSRSLGSLGREVQILRSRIRWRMLLAGTRIGGGEDLDLLSRMLDLRDNELATLPGRIAALEPPRRLRDVALAACDALEQSGRLEPLDQVPARSSKSLHEQLQGIEGPDPAALRAAAMASRRAASQGEA